MVLPTDNFYALLIGVGKYESPDFPHLPVTVTDAQTMDTVLCDPRYCAYPRSNVQMLVGEQANLLAIRNALKDLARKSALAGTVIIYFSGHGGRGRNARGEWQAYLCPRGAKLDALEHTAISSEELSQALAAISAERLVLVLDMCFAGGADMKAPQPAGPWKSGWPDDAYEALTRGAGRVIIASSEMDQVSHIRRENDMSVFTYHLVDALRGKAAHDGEDVVGVIDAYKYVSKAVQQEVPTQKPVLKVPYLVDNFPLALAAQQPPETPPAQPEQPEQLEVPTSPPQHSISVGRGVGLQKAKHITNNFN